MKDDVFLALPGEIQRNIGQSSSTEQRSEPDLVPRKKRRVTIQEQSSESDDSSTDSLASDSDSSEKSSIIERRNISTEISRSHNLDKVTISNFCD